MGGFNYFIMLTCVIIYTGHWYVRSILVWVLVSVYSLRLSTYMMVRVCRNTEGEDKRLAEHRERWNKWGGRPCEYIMAFLEMYLGGYIAIFVASASSLYCIYFTSDNQFIYTDYIGAAIWIIGFIIEAVADWQMNKFRNNPENKGKCMNKGLWRYSRHPNYFGDALLWWGIYIFALSLETGWATFYSALVMTIVLRFIDGVPALEKQMKEREYY